MSFQGGFEQTTPVPPPEEGVREISLETAEGIREFLANAEETYQEAQQFEGWAKNRNYEGLSTTEVEGGQLFTEMYIRMTNIRDLAAVDPEELTPDEVAEMQDCYDDILKIRDHIFDVYEKVETVVLQEPEAEVEETADENSKEPLAAAETQPESSVFLDEPAVLEEPASEETVEPSETESVSVEAEVLGSENETTLAKEKEEIKRVFLRGIEMHDTYLRSGKLQESGPLVDQLKTTLERARVVQEKIDEMIAGSEDPNVVSVAAEKYTRVTAEIDSNLSAIEDVLERKDTAEPTPEVVQEESEATSESESELEPRSQEAEEQPVEATTVSEDEEPSVEPVRPEGRPSFELLPTEADVATVLKEMDQNQFYTAEERTTARSMAESFYRSAAEKADAEKVRKQFKSLNKFIENLHVHPGPQYLDERIDRITKRVGNASKESDIIETVNTLKENYDRIKTEDPENEERIVSAYKTVEEVALQHEVEWLSVCGMRMPKAGPGGVFGARSMREGLLLARDRHADLVQNPEKQVLVDKMVRILARVPNEGLTEDDVSELTELARQIDSPEKVIGNFVSEEKEEQPTDTFTRSKAGEDTDVFADGEGHSMTWPETPKTEAKVGKLEVTKDDADDGPIILSDKTEDIRRVDTDDESTGKEPAVEREDVDETVEFPSTAAVYAEATTSAEDAVIIDSTSPEAVAKEAEETIEAEVDTGVVAEEPVSESDRGAFVEVEISDPIDEVVPEPDDRPTVRSWRERRAEAGSLVELGGLINEYDDFFSTYEPTEFDRVMRSEVRAYEQKMSDGLENFLGIKRNSAFEFMKGMAIHEIQTILGEYGAAQRSDFEDQFNVRYETFVAWCDQIEEMGSLIEVTDDMTFGELYARWIIEQEQR
tara:strand:+ start:6820 stop:9477 length:2658 start_codon:yes stop_codon:yes gene_type:complete